MGEAVGEVVGEAAEEVAGGESSSIFSSFCIYLRLSSILPFSHSFLCPYRRIIIILRESVSMSECVVLQGHQCESCT